MTQTRRIVAIGEQKEKIKVTADLPESACPVFRDFVQTTRPHRARSQTQLRRARDLQSCTPVQSLPEPDRTTTLFFLQVVEDLVDVGWVFKSAPSEDSPAAALWAIPPASSAGSEGVSSQKEVKRRLRQVLLKRRDEQLREPAVQRFVKRMERPGRHGGRQVSVQDLFADGEELSNDIRRRLRASRQTSENLLLDAVDPFLQRVTDDRDSHTGLKLQDIWRYCRYTWSLPQNQQPGRRIYYLVRDQARPRNPIMGIGALGSSPVQISPRDSEIGWTLEALRELVNGDEADQELARRRFRALETTIRSAIDNVYKEDLVRQGIIPEDRSQKTSQRSLNQLESFLESGPLVSRMDGPPDGAPVMEATKTTFYKQKRASALLNLYGAVKKFERAREESDASIAGCVSWLLDRQRGRGALKKALRSLKKRQVGSSVMSITTCGAVPPYNPILGGKLVSFLMASPQVIEDYRQKYEDHSSHIASRMKGESLVRDNSLVLLTTTSLYHVGSSQYNRLKAPTKEGELRFHELDERTSGFGSVHLSRRTYDTLQKLQELHPDLDIQSSRMGSGVNYKMRSIASGLSLVGMQPLLNHQNPRVVYLIPLAENWREYLNGIQEEPDYIYGDESESETEDLIEFWKERWFDMRASKPEILLRVERSSKVKVSDLPDTEAKSSETNSHSAEDQPAARSSLASDSSPPKSTLTAFMSSDSLQWSTFAELYRDRASFAERLSKRELELIHVETKLDRNLLGMLQEGRRVYLTGNPGDGKTHIIEKYREEIEDTGAFVELDASATPEKELAQDIEKVIHDERPALIAVNEGPLRQLIDVLPDDEKKKLQRQLNQPFSYTQEDSHPSNPVLANLGLRQLLTEDVVDRIIDVALENVDYNEAPNVVSWNADRLREPRIRDRIQRLLKLVARSGAHVPMHQILGFFAYIITGGYKSASWAEKNASPYYQHVFDSDSPLSGLLEDLDPVALTHPSIDARIWDGQLSKETQWVGQVPSSPAPVNCDSPGEASERFRNLKRRYFFEAEDGGQVLDMIPTDRNSFFELLDGRGTDSAKVEILEAISEFFGGSTSENLPVWTGLRYDARNPPSAFIAARSTSVNAFELLKPELPPESARLVEYVPDHVRIRLREGASDRQPGLDVDLRLWMELLKIQEGVPSKYRDQIVEKRLTRFLSRVATELRSEDGFVRVRVRDLDADDTYSLGVSLEKGREEYRLD